MTDITSRIAHNNPASRGFLPSNDGNVVQTPTPGAVGVRQPSQRVPYAPKQLRAMELRGQGLSVKEVAAAMFVSESSIRGYLSKARTLWAKHTVGEPMPECMKPDRRLSGYDALTTMQRAVLLAVIAGVPPKIIARKHGFRAQNVYDLLRKVRRHLACENDIQLGAACARLGLL